MKKLINAVDGVLNESLNGFGAAHGDLVTVSRAPKFVTRAGGARQGKVALISGGGSGHEPLHAGFVGTGMLDAACPGEVFTSPTPDQMVAAAQAVDGGAGVLFIVKNYSGDVMNFEMAAEMLRGRARHGADQRRRRGRGLDLHHRAGAASPAPWWSRRSSAPPPRKAPTSLPARPWATGSTAHRLDGRGADQLHRARRRQADLRARRGEMEMGVGIHGEPGRRRVALATADEIAAEMIGRHHARPSIRRQATKVLLLVNGFGGTPLMELYLVYQAAAVLCQDRGLVIARSLVGNYCHLARHGWLLDHRHPARRRDAPALGRAGPHRGSALG